MAAAARWSNVGLSSESAETAAAPSAAGAMAHAPRATGESGIVTAGLVSVLGVPPPGLGPLLPLVLGTAFLAAVGVVLGSLWPSSADDCVLAVAAMPAAAPAAVDTTEDFLTESLLDFLLGECLRAVECKEKNRD